MSRLPKLVIFGRQGGQGTVGHRVAAHLGIHHISTGEILRREMAEASPLGVQVQAFVDHGELVPDDVMLKVIEHRIGHPEVSRRGFLMDGFPRTVEQADGFAAILGGEPLQAAIQIEVPTDVVLARILGRRLPCVRHDDLGAARSSRCLSSRRRLGVRRKDDTETRSGAGCAVRRGVGPLVRWFADRGLLVTVDGAASPGSGLRGDPRRPARALGRQSGEVAPRAAAPG
jgi:adenylate kinase